MIIQVKCPHCSQAASAYLIHAGDSTIFGAATRHFFSSCVGCGGEFEAVEFLAPDSKGWEMNKYRAAVGVDCEWTVVQNLPEDQLPLVVVGPGGEYYKAVRIRESRLERFFIKALTNVKKVFNHESHVPHEGCKECKCGKV